MSCAIRGSYDLVNKLVEGWALCYTLFPENICYFIHQVVWLVFNLWESWVRRECTELLFQFLSKVINTCMFLCIPQSLQAPVLYIRHGELVGQMWPDTLSSLLTSSHSTQWEKNFSVQSVPLQPLPLQYQKWRVKFLADFCAHKRLCFLQMYMQFSVCSCISKFEMLNNCKAELAVQLYNGSICILPGLLNYFCLLQCKGRWIVSQSFENTVNLVKMATKIWKVALEWRY